MACKKSGINWKKPMKMDETNLTEAQLRSWRPRRPSPRVERQLFGKPTASRGRVWLWSSLVPATACAILTLMAGLTNPTTSTRYPGMIPAALSNFDSAAYASGPATAPQNHMSAVSFDCTNHGNAYSILAFASTNLSH